MNTSRVRLVGYLLTAVGVIFFVVAGIAYMKTQEGYAALDAFSSEQNVVLTYNEDGELTDRGTTEGADAILALLTEDWGFTINAADLDPDDPIVDTATEYMYQMATINYHVLHGTQTIVLTEDKEYDANGDGTIAADEVFPAGEYEFQVDGRYYSEFDRSHPLEGPARGQAWSPIVFGLTAQLGVGTTTAYTLQLALGLAALFAALGGTLLLTGLGLVWASRPEKAAAAA
ncbi:MAG TPA: hypothetical protein VFY15_04260 [Acidimicrobiia bacterium]|nr:hypothetical protein [Acidimicrobiia bacterium]